MKAGPRVSVIILNWNGWRDTIECLESLFLNDYPYYDVILVDNGSRDDSIARLREFYSGGLRLASPSFEYPVKVYEYDNTDLESAQKVGDDRTNKLIIVKNDRNYGFAEGNNVGIRFSEKILCNELILLLNNDTVVHKRFLTRLVDCISGDDKVAIAGPTVFYYNYEGKRNIVNFAGGKINWLIYPGYHHIGTNTSRDIENEKTACSECDWITGAAMMIRSDLLHGRGLNREYFFGCEDVELSLNTIKMGYKNVIVNDSYVWHKIGSSRKSRKKISGYLKDARSNLKLLVKNNNMFSCILLLPIHLFQIAVILSRNTICDTFY